MNDKDKSNKKTRVNLITAVSENRVIGANGNLPWRLRDELKLYKKTTLGSILIMGRTTFDSIVHPLPGRESWVLTRNKNINFPDGVRIFHAKQDILDAINKEQKPIFINGGAQIYEMFLPQVTHLYYTVVHAQIDGDTFFPELDWSHWDLKEENHQQANERNSHSWTQKIYERK